MVFAGVAVAVAAAALSHLVKKADVLQEQSNLTISREGHMEGEIIFNIDVILAKRKISVTELAK